MMNVSLLELKQRYEHNKATEITGTKGHEDHNEGSLHSVIGISLLLGFVFMLLIDQIGSSRSSRGIFLGFFLLCFT